MEKVYISSSGYKDVEVSGVKKLEYLLETELNYLVYSPFRDTLYEFSPETYEAVKQENVINIQTSDWVVAYLTYTNINDAIQHYIPDEGVRWEIGYAHALEKPIITILDTACPTINIMIKYSSKVIIMGLSKFIEAMRKGKKLELLESNLTKKDERLLVTY